VNALRQIQNGRLDEPRRKPFYSDISFWSLIAANLVVIVLAQIRNWSLASVLWIHWSQSLIIGLFWFFRIVELKDFDAQGLRRDNTLTIWGVKLFDYFDAQDSKMDSAFRDKAELAAGHIFLYVSIHLGFIFWIRSLGSESSPTDFRAIAIGAFLFLIAQCLAYPKSNRWIAKRRPTAAIIGFPFIRTLPIYLAMVVTGLYATASTLLIFLAAKAFVDVVMYVVEYSCFGDSSYPEKTFLDYEPPKTKHDRCEFCDRLIEDWETPWVIKDHIVCEQCYRSIRKEKQKESQTKK